MILSLLFGLILNYAEASNPKFKFKDKVTIKADALTPQELFHNINEMTVGEVWYMSEDTGHGYHYIIQFICPGFKRDERHHEDDLILKLR